MLGLIAKVMVKNSVFCINIIRYLCISKKNCNFVAVLDIIIGKHEK